MHVNLQYTMVRSQYLEMAMMLKEARVLQRLSGSRRTSRSLAPSIVRCLQRKSHLNPRDQ